MFMQWYTVYTHANCEEKVAENLRRKHLETYCPINHVVRKLGDKKNIVQQPLFSSYVFVRAQESTLSGIKKVDHVVNFVYWLNKPLLIKDFEIELMKTFIEEHPSIRLEKIPVCADRMADVINIEIMNKEGNIITLSKQNARLEFPAMGYILISEQEDFSNIRIIQPTFKVG